MQKKFLISINVQNHAFENNMGTEIARILRELAGTVENGSFDTNLLDANGNKIGVSSLRQS